MYSYALKFKVDGTPADCDLRILDAEKNEILFRPRYTDGMKDGSAPFILYTDKSSRQPLYNILPQKKNDVDSYLIRTPGEAVLGELVAEADHIWNVADANGNPIAIIREKSAWKNSCLFMLLTFPFELLSDPTLHDTILKIIAPHRYILTRDGKKVMELRETVSTINDDYSLKKSADFSEREESLFVVSLITALGLKE
jgi:hypothetical protein